VLAAAFALSPGEVSAPVRTDDGCWLVKVVDVDVVPSDARLIEQLRKFRAQEFAQKLLRDASIEIVAAEATR
jgi:parvulin-like peptidyl-prolyl isomerase